MTLKVQLLNEKLFLTGTTKHSPHFASIPGAIWSKKHLAWTYPRSPIALVRLCQSAREIGESINLDQSTQELQEEWKRIKNSKFWKTEKGRDAADKTLSLLNPWDTKTKPWTHQVCANEFGVQRSAVYYAMKMGTGKTLVTMQEILRCQPYRTLILCPKGVVDVWGSEFQEHAPNHPFSVVLLNQTGSKKKHETLLFALTIAEARHQPLIAVVNYDSAFRKGLGDYLLGIDWDLLVFDEMHRIKMVGGKTSRWTMKLKSPRKIGMSGTPLPNNCLDAYGQFRTLDPAAFGTNFAVFRARYAELNPFNRNYPEIVGWKNEEEFNRILDLYMFRVDEDVLNLPPFTNTFRSVPLPRAAQAIYNKLERELCVQLASGKEISAANVLAKAMKLREICTGFVYDDKKNIEEIHDERAKALKEVLEDISPEDQVVIFAEFQPDFNAIKSVANDLGRTYGEVSGRAHDLVDGKLPPNIQILAAHPKSGGEGVQLQSAHYCIFYSFSYNLAEHWQARARLHRGGQKEQVTYIYLTSPDTIEPSIYRALKSKGDVVNAIMDYVKRGGINVV